MPTVLRVHGLRFVLWPNDHNPPHVHVFAAETEATILRGDSNDFPRLIENRRMSKRDISRALEVVHEHQLLFRQRWSEIHD